MTKSLRGKRHVLFIPREEIERLLTSQPRKDVKVVVPALLSAVKAEGLRAQGKVVKREVPFESERWTITDSETIPVCASSEFVVPGEHDGLGGFAVSFALPGAPQTMHEHRTHWEMYYAEQRLCVVYRLPNTDEARQEELVHGGLALLGPGVAHQVTCDALMLVLEVPSVASDKALVDCDA